MASQDSEYLKLFLEDAEEQLLALNRCMLDLEKRPDDRSLLDELFRCAHNLKGGSATMGFLNMEKLTHEMENVLGMLRNGELKVGADMADCLFQCLDRLNRLIELISCGDGDCAEVEDQCVLLRSIIDGGAVCEASAGAGGDEAGGDEGSGLSRILVSLSEYDALVAHDEIARGRRVLEVVVAISESTSMRSARAFVIYNNLKGHGDVTKYYPDLDQFDEADKHTIFCYLISTEEEDDALREAVWSPDVEFIEILDAAAFLRNVEITDAPPEAPAAEEAPVVAEAKIEQPAAEEPAPARHVEPVVEPVVELPKKKEKDVSAQKETAQDDARKGSSKSMSTLRVDTDRLDLIMNLVGELVINKTRFAQVRLELSALEDELAEARVPHALSQRLKNMNSEFDMTYQQIGRIAGDLQTRVMQIRMLPISNVFMRFERVVRDLARSQGRQVQLEITGQDTELDKTVIEVIGDPLMHIVRNAIAHGIEAPAERVAVGKPEDGRIDMRAYHEGNHVVIEIEDDGKGIDPDKLKATAVRKGLLTQEQADKMSDRDAINIIFMASFSTTESADNVSGRGVGMDVVSRNIEKLNGSIDVKTKIGSGTCFIIRIPLTLATIQALLVSVAGEIFAIPLVNIVETVRILPENIDRIEGREVTLLRGSVLSLLRLDEVLGLPHAKQKQYIYIVVAGIGDRRVGLIVHKLIGQQEIVIKTLGDYFGDTEAVAGASILGDGRVSLILDVYSLVDMGVRHVNVEVEGRKRSGTLG